MRTDFQSDLDSLEAGFQEMGEVVSRAIRGAVDALRTQDVELCDEVIAFDDEIDDRYLGMENQIHLVLARQTPVATDLRLVLALLHSAIHAERMGDQCVTIAKLTKLVAGLEPDSRMIQAFEEMGSRAEEMIKVALEAFVDRDVDEASSLVDLDELIDRANRRVVRQVLELDPELSEWGVRMLLVSRCLERIGDHAVDIGEQTAYLVTGDFREFTDASHPEEIG